MSSAASIISELPLPKDETRLESAEPTYRELKTHPKDKVLQDWLISTNHHDIEWGMMGDSGPPEDGYKLTTIKPKVGSGRKTRSCVIADGMSVGWPDNEQVIRNLSFTIKWSQFTVVTGGMGSGKSTLLDAILGQSLISAGTISTSFTRAAYCSQTPWLLNQTIRQNILGAFEFDASWYTTVLKVCALEQDIQNMSAGDQSIIGSEGIRLSGGQRKRLV